MAEPVSAIWLMVTSPNHEVSPSPAQPAANTTAYLYQAQEDPSTETVADIVQRVAGSFGMGCTLIAIDAALVETFTIAPTVQAA